MIIIAAVIAAAVALGIALHRRAPERSEAGARRLLTGLLWVAVPFVAFFNLAVLELTAEVGAGIAYGYAAITVPMAIAFFVGPRLLGLDRPSTGALMLAGALGNTGYLGLPFAAAALGSDTLPDAVAYDTLVTGIASTTIGFAVGAAFGTHAQGVRERAASFITRNPPLWASVAGLLAPAALAPDLLVDASLVLVYAMLPLGFVAVGVIVSAESHGLLPRMSAPVATALVLKLGVAPVVVALLASALLHVPDTYVLQAAMATALACLLVANEYELDRGLVAAAITWSTALVVAAGLVAALF